MYTFTLKIFVYLNLGYTVEIIGGGGGGGGGGEPHEMRQF